MKTLLARAWRRPLEEGRSKYVDKDTGIEIEFMSTIYRLAWRVVDDAGKSKSDILSAVKRLSHNLPAADKARWDAALRSGDAPEGVRDMHGGDEWHVVDDMD